MKHYPVMLNEVLQYLSPKDGEVYVDATFGNGGYTEAILKAAKCKVISIDRDPSVMPRVAELKAQYGDRFEFVEGQFGDFKDLVNQPINGAVFDIGVSSMQLDEGDRGFSFSKDAPLDMRMSKSGLSASDIVNSMDENELADLIYKYGEERKSRQIARRIAEYRTENPIESTTELAKIIYTVLHKRPNEIDPATRTFQAIRIAVNNELEELENGLSGATELLDKDGRLVVVSFHSLEDRIIKNFMREKAGKNESVSRYMPEKSNMGSNVVFKDVSKAVKPSDKEIEENKRSRSAKLRCAVKI